MDSFDRTIRYLFILSLVLIAVAYYLGTTNVLDSLFRGANNILLTSTGRTSSGQFAGYAQ